MYADDGLLFFDEDSGEVTFCCDEMSILSVNLNNINVDNNFHENDSDTIIVIRLLAGNSLLSNAFNVYNLEVLRHFVIENHT